MQPSGWREQYDRSLESVRREMRRLRSRQTTEMNALDGSCQTLVAAKQCALRAGTVPLALLLGATSDPITINWPVTFANTDYRIDVTPLTGVLGRATINQTAKTKASVTYTVTATLAVAAGAQFLVHACSSP